MGAGRKLRSGVRNTGVWKAKVFYCFRQKGQENEAGVSRETTVSQTWTIAHLLCSRHCARHQRPTHEHAG